MDQKEKMVYTRLSKTIDEKKSLRYLMETHGEDYRAEMNMIRSQFRKMKKEEIKKLKGKEIGI